MAPRRRDQHQQFGTGQSATFTYTGPTGTRTVTLLATDADGQTDTETKSLNLVEASAPLAACANGRDDDNDGLTDMADPGCTGPTDNDESNVLPPPPAGKPGPDNTGLTVPLSELTPRTGPITVNQAGAVLEKLDITYTGSQTAVQVNAPNVTIRNVRIRSNGISLIQTDGATGLADRGQRVDQPAGGRASRTAITRSRWATTPPAAWTSRGARTALRWRTATRRSWIRGFTTSTTSAQLLLR